MWICFICDPTALWISLVIKWQPRDGAVTVILSWNHRYCFGAMAVVPVSLLVLDDDDEERDVGDGQVSTAKARGGMKPVVKAGTEDTSSSNADGILMVAAIVILLEKKISEEDREYEREECGYSPSLLSNTWGEWKVLDGWHDRCVGVHRDGKTEFRSRGCERNNNNRTSSNKQSFGFCWLLARTYIYPICFRLIFTVAS